MTPQELKREVERGKDSFFFTPATLKFFGDRMSNYGVRDGGRFPVHYDDNGDNYSAIPRMVPVWELYRKKPVLHGLDGSAHFCKKTFRRIF